MSSKRNMILDLGQKLYL